MPCQQQELYRAERQAPIGLKLDSTKDAQVVLDAVRNTPFFLDRWPQVRHIEVEVLDRGDSVGQWVPEDGAGRIELSKKFACERTLLHEIAHVVVHAEHGVRGAHGPHFCRAYLELVYVRMGRQAYQALRDGMDAEGVQHVVEPSERLGQARAMPSA